MVFFEALQFEDEVLQGKELSVRWWKIPQLCDTVLYFELTIHDFSCFVLNSKSHRTEVMHRLLPVGSNNMQSLYNPTFLSSVQT